MIHHRHPQIYENNETKAEEAEIARRIEQLYGCSMFANPKHHQIDFSAHRNNRVVAFLEAKGRKCRHDRYATYTVSATKGIAARNYHALTGLPVFIAVQWTDMLGIARLDGSYVCTIGGNYQRNNPADVEPQIHIPLQEFKLYEQPRAFYEGPPRRSATGGADLR